MRHRLHKLLLILVTLSLAFAPLRGAWALPDAGTADTESHCAGMQHDMQQMDHDTGHGGKADNNPHKCKSGCNGSCCDKSCGACLHAAAAIAVSLVVLPDTPVHEHSWPGTDAFSERHLKPPLRPPLALL